MLLALAPPLARRTECLVDLLDQELLRLAVPGPAAAVPPRQLVSLVGTGEQGVEREHVVLPGILRRLDRRAVGDDLHDGVLQCRALREDLDRVSVGLAHLLAVRPRYDRRL